MDALKRVGGKECLRGSGQKMYPSWFSEAFARQPSYMPGWTSTVETRYVLLCSLDGILLAAAAVVCFARESTPAAINVTADADDEELEGAPGEVFGSGYITPTSPR